MLAHEKIRKSLASKSKGRGKSSSNSKSSKKPASPPSTSVPLDIDDRFKEQHDRLVRDMDDRMELLSSSLLDQIKALIGVQDSQSDNHDRDIHGASKFPRRDSVHSVPEPPQQRSRAASEGGRGTQKAGVARDESLSRLGMRKLRRVMKTRTTCHPVVVALEIVKVIHMTMIAWMMMMMI